MGEDGRGGREASRCGHRSTHGEFGGGGFLGPGHPAEERAAELGVRPQEDRPQAPLPVEVRQDGPHGLVWPEEQRLRGGGGGFFFWRLGIRKGPSGEGALSRPLLTACGQQSATKGGDASESNGSQPGRGRAPSLRGPASTGLSAARCRASASPTAPGVPAASASAAAAADAAAEGSDERGAAAAACGRCRCPARLPALQSQRRTSWFDPFFEIGSRDRCLGGLGAVQTCREANDGLYSLKLLDTTRRHDSTVDGLLKGQRPPSLPARQVLSTLFALSLTTICRFCNRGSAVGKSPPAGRCCDAHRFERFEL